MRLALALVLLAACSATGTAAATPPTGAVIVTAAVDSFTTSSVVGPADTGFTIFFQIIDSSQHDLHVWQGETSVAATEIFGGPSARILDVPALASGVYRITCDIHPSMEAALEAV
ncbi:MAG: cupredoxin domain-containing protein [Chloroflexota bacterium]